MDELERQADRLLEADWLVGDVDAVRARAARIAARRRRMLAGAVVVMILLVLGAVAVARVGPDRPDTVSAADAQTISCAAVIRSGVADRSVEVMMVPSAGAADLDRVRQALAASGLGHVLVHTVDENRFLVREVFAGRAEPPGVAATLGASVTGSLAPGTPLGDVDQVLTAARNLPGVAGASAGAVPCRIDDVERRGLLERYLRDRWQHGADAAVFLAPESTPAQRDAVAVALQRDPAVRQAWALTQQDAHDELLCRFADDASLLDMVKPDVLPWSYRVDVGGDRATAERVTSVLSGMPGVPAVATAPTLDDLTRLPADAAGYQQLTRTLTGDRACASPGHPLK